MKFNTEILKELKPCTDRFKNWLEHYKKWDGELIDFLDLTEITHRDKLWVYFRLIPKDKIALVAADFAEHVLHIYESKYPDNKAPRLAIEAARSTIMTIEEKRAAYAAAYAAAAYAAAYAAADAASRSLEEKYQIETMKKWIA